MYIDAKQNVRYLLRKPALTRAVEPPTDAGLWVHPCIGCSSMGDVMRVSSHNRNNLGSCVSISETNLVEIDKIIGVVLLFF